MKTIKGDLVLTENVEFDEDLKVEGNIRGYFNLKVAGDIHARDIYALNIDARDIDARNIIFCQSVKLKDKTKGKIKAKAVIRNRFNLKQKEFESD